MRKGLGILITLLLATSCYREMVLEVPGSPEGLLVNAQLSTADQSHSVFVGLSSSSRVLRLHSVEVSCSVNGGDRIIAEDVLSGGRLQAEYRFNASLEPGDRLSIGVKDAEGRTAGAEVTVPELSGEIISIDTSSVGGKVYFSIKLRNNREGRNYYMLTLDKYFRAHLDDINPNNGSTFTFLSEGVRKCLRLSYDSDAVLSGGYIGDAGENDVIGTGIENVNCVFSNARFIDDIATVKVYVDSTSLYGDEIVDYYISGVKDNSAIVSLHSISKQEYDYLWALNSLQVSGFHISDMMEPVSIPMNVSGGYGFVSASSCSSMRVGLKRQFLKR